MIMYGRSVTRQCALNGGHLTSHASVLTRAQHSVRGEGTDLWCGLSALEAAHPPAAGRGRAGPARTAAARDETRRRAARPDLWRAADTGMAPRCGRRQRSNIHRQNVHVKRLQPERPRPQPARRRCRRTRRQACRLRYPQAARDKPHGTGAPTRAQHGERRRRAPAKLRTCSSNEPRHCRPRLEFLLFSGPFRVQKIMFSFRKIFSQYSVPYRTRNPWHSEH